MSQMFSENLLSCVKCAVQPAVYNQMLNATFGSTQDFGWDFSLAHYECDKIPLN